MSLFEATSGTLVNVVAVVGGSLVGMTLRGRLPDDTVRVVMQAIGLTTIVVGLRMAWDLGRVDDPPGIVVALLALVAGGIAGEALRIERGLDRLAETVRGYVGGGGTFTEGLVTASLLFCVGPLTLIGSIQNGLTGDAGPLLVKSTLDGLSSIALATTLGAGVLASSAVVLVLQGSLSLAAGALASWIPDPASDPRILLINGVGGVLILGLGVTLLDLVKVRVAAMLPAMVLAVPLWWLLSLLPAF